MVAHRRPTRDAASNDPPAPSPAPIPSGSAGAGGNTSIDLDQLIRETRRSCSPTRIIRVYRAVLSLPHWFFVRDTTELDLPLLWVVSSEPSVLAFSDALQAGRAAVMLDLEDDEGLVNLIEMQVPRAVRWLQGLTARGVVRIVFNVAGEPFPMRIAELPAALERCRYPD